MTKQLTGDESVKGTPGGDKQHVCAQHGANCKLDRRGSLETTWIARGNAD